MVGGGYGGWGGGGRGRLSFVTSRQQAKCISRTDPLRHVRAATLRQKLQIQLALSSSHRMLTPAKVVLAQTP